MNSMMTTQEVAKFLKIAEKTVEEWAANGELAGAKLDNSWRFRRSDVDKFIKSRMVMPDNRDVTDLKLDTLLARDRILIIDDISKKELFDKMINILASTPYVKNVSDLRTAVYEREDLMSTGIGLNLGIPHVRIKSVKDMAVAFALVKNGVAEYESLDSEPVKLVFMIIAREDQHTQHLKFLSQLSTVLKNDDFRNALIECDNADDLYTLLCGGVDEK